MVISKVLEAIHKAMKAEGRLTGKQRKFLKSDSRIKNRKEAIALLRIDKASRVLEKKAKYGGSDAIKDSSRGLLYGTTPKKFLGTKFGEAVMRDLLKKKGKGKEL